MCAEPPTLDFSLSQPNNHPHPYEVQQDRREGRETSQAGELAEVNHMVLLRVLNWFFSIPERP